MAAPALVAGFLLRHTERIKMSGKAEANATNESNDQPQHEKERNDRGNDGAVPEARYASGICKF